MRFGEKGSRRKKFSLRKIIVRKHARVCNEQSLSSSQPLAPSSSRVAIKRKGTTLARWEFDDHKERKVSSTPQILMEQKQKGKRKREEREREWRVEWTRWQPDRICVETQTAPVSNTPGTLSKSDNFRSEGNSERGERWNTLELSHPRKAGYAEGCWGGYPLYFLLTSLWKALPLLLALLRYNVYTYDMKIYARGTRLYTEGIPWYHEYLRKCNVIFFKLICRY